MPLDFFGEFSVLFPCFERDFDRDFELLRLYFLVGLLYSNFLDLERSFFELLFAFFLLSSKAALLPLIRVLRGKPDPSMLLL